MPPDPPPSEPADTAPGSLCTACGLCCDGTLFHIVRLQPADSARQLSALGMKLRRRKKDPYFTQPCAFLHDCRCAIYEHRPQRCRHFECRVLQRLQNDEITPVAAHALIRQARQIACGIEVQLASGDDTAAHLPLLERCEAALAAIPSGTPASSNLSAALQELQRLLRAEFHALG